MKLDLKVPDLACSACVKTVTKAVHDVEADIKNVITATGDTVA